MWRRILEEAVKKYSFVRAIRARDRRTVAYILICPLYSPFCRTEGSDRDGGLAD
ncbi:hypothetical protein GLOTRDRAFT_110544 [Gloeophyllum trabeum ATCC 11539]|uniref:Uncharacterized protein n=1 Tax=Gloeophyllum trabeum (strain ATCC 11539 / FP-39264 / Madison 617) TaxID=670483 RepID=S7QDH1_GLOTA|nr:uncharacterized protein GLOTRDRAFT_110544 [Gloeophyllum trabeum ATCC 11539]EPQ57377.1 hypothetical protein GLOTRDRAFT_110544 [Gloeophyllum trabeum ATCC 11539]